MGTSLCGSCAAVPAGVKIASLVGDGISYATTGKSLTDHLLSGALNQDCALLRVVEGDSICRPDPVKTESETRTENTVASTAREPSPGNSAGRSPLPPADYLVVGSFANPQHAKQWQLRYRGFPSALATERLPGTSRFRVVVGPVSADSLDSMRRRLAAVSTNRPWKLALCPTTLKAPPCQAPPMTVAQN